MEKYPDQNLTDKFFEQVFANKREVRPKPSKAEANQPPPVGDNVSNGDRKNSPILPRVGKLIMPAHRNLIEYGIQGQVNDLLLN